MGIDGLGSSVIIALAAVLWFLYLVPTWFRRREYLATERNAVRLQQTMRIMAESAELPAPVRVAVNSRSVAEQRRALKKVYGAPRYRRSSPINEPEFKIEFSDAKRASRRLRRSRALASFVLLVSLVAAGFGVNLVLTGGSWMLLAASVLVAFGCFALLKQAASVARARRAAARATGRVVVSRRDIHDEADYLTAEERSWTPVPVPRPLYLREQLEVEEVAPRVRVADHVAVLQAAAEEAERALRAAQAAPEVARLNQSARTAQSVRDDQAARFDQMGRVDLSNSPGPNLDEILRRRRAAG